MPSSALATLDEALLSTGDRARALERFSSTHSGREKPGRFWRVDFESLVAEPHAIDPGLARTDARCDDARIVVCDLATAAREYPEPFGRAFGATAARSTKFGALNSAFAGLGTFVYVPADLAADAPIVIRYEAAPGASIFPSTVVLAERGSRATVIEHLSGAADSLLCSVVEIVSGENAEVEYACMQRVDEGARVLSSRYALPGLQSHVSLCVAELGGSVAAADLNVRFDRSGAEGRITAIFFPSASRHVDVVSTVEHDAGDATSETLVKSAARERGQARFLGNIRIAPHAQGSDARLRDDALLLSATAHVDSVPALEIAANDVKAYHGATVGALDEEQIFYMESRGIERDAAERTIALGFFEPAIERFPSASLRDEIRASLAATLS